MGIPSEDTRAFGISLLANLVTSLASFVKNQAVVYVKSTRWWSRWRTWWTSRQGVEEDVNILFHSEAMGVGLDFV